MTPVILLIVYTINILGSLSSPFEFDGDYGPELNQIRSEVLDLVLPHELKVQMELQAPDLKMNGDQLLADAALRDAHYGPTLNEIVTKRHLDQLRKKQQEISSFSNIELEEMIHFVNTHGEKHLFKFLNSVSFFLGLDKALMDVAAQNNELFTLPILGSLGKLSGDSPHEFTSNLLSTLFNEETFAVAPS